MWQRKSNREKESDSETRRELLDKLGMERLNK